MATIGADITKAKSFLENGELVAIPTETVYGLAGNAFNENAVTNIFKTKKRPAFDPLIVHADSVEKVKTYVSDFPEMAEKLASHFWPGSLTMILPRSEKIHDLITSGLDTVAVRVPKHPLTLELLATLDFPVAAPSANPFGYVSPTSATHVNDNLGEFIPYILDGGECQVGIESTIVGFPDGVPTVYRKGGISIEEIEQVIGKIEVRAHSSSQPTAPGMLKKHYAPDANILIGDIDELYKEFKGKNLMTLSLNHTVEGLDTERQFHLSSEGDLAEAAQNLFKMLRKLDTLQPEIILTQLLPEEGLGVAINDRLRRAAAK